MLQTLKGLVADLSNPLPEMFAPWDVVDVTTRCILNKPSFRSAP